MTDMIQFAPARAKKKTEEPLLLAMTEQKIDGQRYVIQTRQLECGTHSHGCTSRRVSEVTGMYVEKQDRVPHLASVPFEPMSMIDCEFVSPEDIVLAPLRGLFWDKLLPHPHMDWLKRKFDGAIPVYPHVSMTTSIMGSDPHEAIRKQRERGHVWAYAFDIIQFGGRSVTANSQIKRRNFLARQLESVDPESGLVLMPCWWNLTRDEQEELFYLFTDLEGEGLVIKDPDLPYDHARAWYKWKRDYPVDCVLTGGYKMGNEGRTGKMLGKVGSLEIGVYRSGILYPVGWMSAIMDSEAQLDHITELAINDGLHGMVCEARHNGKQDNREAPLGFTLRHPRWRRWRDDKNATDCTVQALEEEIRKVPK